MPVAQESTQSPVGPDRPLLIPIKEVARLLGIDKRSVYRRVSSGELPKPLRLGGSRRWRLHEIESWVNDGCQPPDASRNGR